MSDDAASHFQTQQPSDNAVKPEGRSVTLSITLHPNGQVEFNLPTNKVLAHGLLGMAQEQLAKMALMTDVQQAASRGGMNGLLKRMNGGRG